MKLILNIFLIIIITIKYIESCIRLTGCSWKGDPCNEYKDMNTCYKHDGCIWGDLEEPQELPINAQVNFGGKPGIDFELTRQEEPNNFAAAPNVQQIINGLKVCKGENYKSCSIWCSIF